jgi:hypothetical protein
VLPTRAASFISFNFMFRSLSTRFRLSLLVPVMILAGCETTPSSPPVPYTGDPVVDGNAHLAVAPARDRVLWEYRVAAAALRRGMFDETKTKLDSALAQAAANFGNVNSEAAKSRRLFRNESDKPFIGEPYERVMANFYRGIVYWHDGEPDNARALYRTAELLDSDTEDKTYAGDYVLLDYLDGLVSAKLGGDGSDALVRARASAKQQGRATPPNYNPKANVMLFVEYGQGPTKYNGGEFGEQLKFFTRPSHICSARMEIDGRHVALPPFDDLNFQAVTRGGRVMDHVLGNKAVFKQASDTVGDVALMGAVVAADRPGRNTDKTALALATVGILSKIASSATTPQADIRAWDNLPQYLSFAALELSPGEHAATLEFLDAQAQPVRSLTQNITILVPPADPSVGAKPSDIVIFLSELKK